jgi:DNA-binding transcriptional LysR family regulator
MYASQDLAALVAIADAGSVRGAAVALGRTQPAVTQAIRRLEEAVGFDLLDRSGYRARLTERGALFVKRARSAVGQARSLRTFAALLAKGVEPRLRIACHGAIPIEAWTGLVENLPEQFPETAFEIELGEGDAPLRRLLNDDAQLALTLRALPDRHGPRLESIPVGDLDFVTIVRTDKRDALVREDSTLPQILVADFEDPEASFGVAEGARHLRVSNHRAKSALILVGAGWGSVPEGLVSDALAQGRVTAVSHRGLRERGRRTFSLCRKRDQVVGPAAAYIWRAAQTIRDRDQVPVGFELSTPMSRP